MTLASPTPAPASPADARAPRRLAQPAVRFLVVGGSNTALCFVVFSAVLRLLGRRPGAPALAQAIAYAAGMAVGYVAHRRLTFRSRGPVARQLPRFVTVNAALLAATAGALELLVDRGRLPAGASWLGVTAVATLANYELQRRVVFPGR